MKKISFIATDNTIIIVYNENGTMKRVQFTKDKLKEFNDIKELLRKQDEDEILLRLGKTTYIINKYSGGQLHVHPDKKLIYDPVTQTNIDGILAKRILEWANDGLPFDPLLKFHRNVIKNPNPNSVIDLYAFLEANLIPITEDGCFLGYKKVTNVNGKLLDSHSKTIDNSIGRVVEMPRENCDDDRTKDCSYGYHIGAFEYVSSFSGDTTLVCEINPEDVVAVPMDYKRQKMRTCKYKVLSIYGEKSQIKEKHVQKEVYVSKTGNKQVYSREELEGMKAKTIKQLILDDYNVEITTDDKNKKSIINKALKIMSGE